MLERYDAVGGWQDTDPLGGPINSTADITFSTVPDGEEDLTGPADLMTGIAACPERPALLRRDVGQLRGRQALRLERRLRRRSSWPPTSSPRPTYSIASMMADFTKSDSFRLRTLGN